MAVDKIEISEEEQKRIGESVGKMLASLISDEREFDVMAYYEGTMTEASAWYISAWQTKILVEDFLTNEDTPKLKKIVVELSPKR